jgi:hypothetical protein
MEPDVGRAARIAALNEEIDTIHRANAPYWEQGKSQTFAARAEYQLRNERLEKIREELARLRPTPNSE